jgi:hypothetical protein
LPYPPVCAVVDGAPVRVEAAVEEARRMLDAFERFAREAASEEYRAEVLARVAEARTTL